MKVERKAVSGIMVPMLLMGMLASAFSMRSAFGSGTIYIRSGGSIDPASAPISTSDYVTYVFTGNIYGSVVIERDNIVVDGAGYTLQGTGVYPTAGIHLFERENVTIRNTQIKNFWNGIFLNESSFNVVSGNTVVGNRLHDIWFYANSCHNVVVGNTIAGSSDGIGLGLYDYSNYNNISRNTIVDNGYGIVFHHASNNSISENNVTANSGHGFWLDSASNNNTVSRNTIVDNGYGVVFYFFSDYNIVNGNNVTANSYHGIWFYYHSNNNSLSENTIANNGNGVVLHSSSNNSFYHNNFLDNGQQVYDSAWDNPEVSPSVNVWDDGYPSGGNYWSDYAGDDADGDEIGDTPHILGENNWDLYPLMSPWIPVEEASPLWMQWWFWAIIAAVIVVSAGTVYSLKRRSPLTTLHPQKGIDAVSVADE